MEKWKQKLGKKQVYRQFLSGIMEHMHRLTDCIKCEASNPTISSMHSSVSDTTQNIIKKQTNELAQEIEYMHTARLFDGPEQLVKMIGPIVENTFKTSMQKPSIKSI